MYRIAAKNINRLSIGFSVSNSRIADLEIITGLPRRLVTQEEAPGGRAMHGIIIYTVGLFSYDEIPNTQS